MMTELENNIYYATIEDFSSDEFANLSMELENSECLDLIVDFSKANYNGKDITIQKILNHQNLCNRLLVLVSKNIHSHGEKLIVVPTKKEAIDYILFEQIQRDLDL